MRRSASTTLARSSAESSTTSASAPCACACSSARPSGRVATTARPGKARECDEDLARVPVGPVQVVDEIRHRRVGGQRRGDHPGARIRRVGAQLLDRAPGGARRELLELVEDEPLVVRHDPDRARARRVEQRRDVAQQLGLPHPGLADDDDAARAPLGSRSASSTRSSSRSRPTNGSRSGAVSPSASERKRSRERGARARAPLRRSRRARGPRSRARSRARLAARRAR